MSIFHENPMYCEDIDIVCRLCLSVSKNNLQIFSSVGESCKLQEKIYKQFSFWIKPEKGIPKAICAGCLTEINKFCSFAEMVEANQKKIQAMMFSRLVASGDDDQHRCEGNLVASNICSNFTPFPVDFDSIVPLELTFRESLSSAGVCHSETETRNQVSKETEVDVDVDKYKNNDSDMFAPQVEGNSYGRGALCDPVPENQTLHDDGRYVATSRILRSTTNHNRVSTEIEVQPDIHNYMYDSNKDSDMFEEPPVEQSILRFIICDPPVENKIFHNGASEVDLTQNLQDLKTDGESNGKQEAKAKNHKSLCTKVDIPQSHDSDAIHVLDQKSLNEPLKSDNGDELTEHPIRWSKKRPLTKAHLARLNKSHKIKEQLDNFFVYCCNDCKGKPKFANFLQLKNHCRDVHKKKASIMCCERTLTERKALIHHMLTQHLQPNEFNCNQCGKSVSTQHMLNLHVINHLPESERPYKCSKCGKGFCSIPYVKKHEKTHHSTDEFAGTFICDVCGKSFVYERKLLVHKRNQHAKVKNPVMCHICAKTFKHESALRSHLMTHNEGRTEECLQCHKFFKNADTVRSHVKQEHRVSPAQCDQCDKVFRSKRKLVCHIKVFHSSEKPFECNICAKRFKLKSGLKTHLVQHTGEKPYRCPYCSRMFASSGNWSTHKKRMHNETKSVSSYAPVLPGK